MTGINSLLITPECKNEPGVYVIANLASGMFYFGSSERLRNRLTSHLWHLRNKRHGNIHLQRAWNKHGEDSFVCSVVRVTHVDDLEMEEQQTIDQYDGLVYNMNKVGAVHRGAVLSDEQKKKMSDSAKANWKRPEYRAAMSKMLSGREMSPEWIAKIARSKTGVPWSEAQRSAYIANPKRGPLGQKQTKEHSAKMAATKAKTYLVTSPDGVESRITNLREFCRNNELEQSHMGKVARGKQKNHKGWLCRAAN